MSSSITGKQYPLQKIFSQEFEYHIPVYQRPYAWGKEQSSELFDDLCDFFRSNPDDSYFLGSIVLIKKDDISYSDVIDGQQRLTTLSILFSVMSYCFKDDNCKTECKDLLQEKGKKISGIPAQPRLFLRDKDQKFFNNYIQNVNLNELLKLGSESISESQRHIQENCLTLLKKMKESFDNDDGLEEFSKFLLNKCYLVVVSSESQDAAFRIFSVLNSRGLDLQTTDIIKSEVIGKIDIDHQGEYTQKWEDLEELAGREGFNEVFTHTRTIFAKDRQRKSQLDEFREYVVNKTTPESLIDDYLTPYTEAYCILKNKKYPAKKNSNEINGLLEWLNKTNNYDWMPPAIKFFSAHKDDADYILWFISKLERLASYLFVTGQDVNKRMDRYRWILVEMDNYPNDSLTRPLKNIELTEWEKKKFIDTLDSEVYLMTSQRRNYIVQRLDSFVSDGGATYDNKIFTIEHVLPQHPSNESEWVKKWTEEERKYWVNRIANLVPLTRRNNSSAQNYDFDTKKKKYFQTKNGVCSFSLTTQVMGIKVWDPTLVKKRQEKLLDIFANGWDLNADASNISSDEFRLAGRGGTAFGHPKDDSKFVVNRGSRISDDITEGISSGCKKLREELINDEIIVNSVFTTDYEFNSPSEAATVVLGRSANGPKEWTRLDGRILGKG